MARAMWAMVGNGGHVQGGAVAMMSRAVTEMTGNAVQGLWPGQWPLAMAVLTMDAKSKDMESPAGQLPMDAP